MKKGTTQLSKFKLLAKRLQLPDWQVVGLLESMWLFAQAETPRGDIGSKSDEAIAIQIGIEPSEWRRARDAMIADQWLDPDSRCRFVVHGFSEHAPEWLKKQLTRAGMVFIVADGGGEFQTLAAGGIQRRTVADSGGQRQPVAADVCPPNPPLPSLTHPLPAPTQSGGSAAAAPSQSPFNGELTLAERDELLAIWNATPGRRASAADCRGLVSSLDRIALSPDVPPQARRVPLTWLLERARAYIASTEATREGSKYKAALRNFLERDKWLEPDEAWNYIAPTGDTPPEDPEARERRIQEIMAENEKARLAR